ncbi:MAG: Holliday junction DNA helicase RuvA, partial [Pirellulales bacterium]|nr:Holliday junction DNA helicase RuvA [Pirellulales bacterium]
AERVIAKLRRKMAKFALLVDVSQASHTADVEQDVVEEVFQILVHLGHSENDSRKLLDSVLAKETSFKDVDSMLQAVYSSSEKP